MKYYRIRDWETRFESSRSRLWNRKTQSYKPNGTSLGYIRMMKEHDGAAIYGAWCAVVDLLSRQESPRRGILTDTGRTTGTPLDSVAIGMLTFIHPEIIHRMLTFCSSQVIGWLVIEYRSDTTGDTASVTMVSPSGALQDGTLELPLTSERQMHRPLPSPSPSPSYKTVNPPEIRVENNGLIRNQDKYEKIRSIPAVDLAQWTVRFCGDELSWVRVYKTFIDKLGPEAFRSILETYVAEIDAGEDGRVRGAVLVNKLKVALANKRGVKK